MTYVITTSKSMFYVSEGNILCFTRQYASDNDGHGAGEALKDVVGILDDNGNNQTSTCVEGHQVPHEQVITKKEALFLNLCERKLRL